MNQISLFEILLPELWVINTTPKTDGVYSCRVRKHNGEIVFMNLECKNKSFCVEDDITVLAWR